MRILFTGASSFTGYWFIKSLAAGGHEIVCPLTGNAERYEGTRKERVNQITSLCRLVPNAPFGSEAFLKAIREDGPWDLLCHHGADVANYRSPDFDSVRSLQNTTLNLRATLAALKSAATKAIILTGSVFEQDEGWGEEPLRAFSPYGLAKGLIWQTFRYYCAEAALPLAKFVIPNPFGPYEEPRFTAYLMGTWKQGKPASVKTPDYLRDNIPVDLLAAAYRHFAGRIGSTVPGCSKINPSGYIETQAAFGLRVGREVRARLRWACELQIPKQDDFSEPLRRVNTDPAARLIPAWNEAKAWDAFAEYYAGNGAT